MNLGSLRTILSHRRWRSGRTRRTVVTLLGGLSISGLLLAQAPDWWTDQGVLDPNQTEQSNRAAVTAGQLKSIAKAARDEMDARYGAFDPPNPGSGTTITALVDGWLTNASTDEQNAAVTVGQVKSVAKPFYDRLAEFGLVGIEDYPWSETGENGALATAGQVKTVFAFDLPMLTNDTDGDGLDDDFETSDPGGWRSDPNLADTDGDGVLDGEEFALGTNPLKKDNAALGLSAFGYTTP